MAAYLSPEQSEQRRIRRRSAPDAKLALAGGDLVPKTFEGSPSEARPTITVGTAQLMDKGETHEDFCHSLASFLGRCRQTASRKSRSMVETMGFRR